jgi:ribonuclease G
MKKQIIINSTRAESRVAIVEEGRVAELFFERHDDRGLVGNIYRGKVSRVLPGMQASFIEVGIDRTTFLYGGDTLDPAYIQQRQEAEQSDSEPGEIEFVRTPVQNLIREGEEITIQVSKEPLGSKGARVTMYLSLPGRYLVLVPEIDHIGISRRIEDDEVRDQLRKKIEPIKPKDLGLIIRTAALSASEEELKSDVDYLVKTWEELQDKIANAKTPSLLYEEPNLPIKTTRDYYSEEVEEIIVDNKETYEELERFFKKAMNDAVSKLVLYEDKVPVFDHYGIEVDIGSALGRRAWLPSGGYLIVDQTEALTAFDVNTGRFVGSQSAHETILKTNMEAVDVIVEQLRIRNIGGIIVIDFIDMDKEEHRELVFNKFEQALRSDKAKTNVLKISELGLVQMTRKRTSESLEHRLMEICPYCDERGRVKSVETESMDMLRDIRRHALRVPNKSIVVKIRSDVKEFLEAKHTDMIDDLQDEFDLKITLLENDLNLALLKEPAYEIIS